MDTAFSYLQSTLVELMINILSDGKLNNTMSNSLSNGSSETFWEFHDEPCGKSNSITLTYDKLIEMFVAFIHTDNQLTLE